MSATTTSLPPATDVGTNSPVAGGEGNAVDQGGRLAKRPRVQRAGSSNADDEKELSRGAEAVVSSVSFFGRRSVVKRRIRKGYRHVELDGKLRVRRTAQEARVLLRLRKAGVRAPAIYDVDLHPDRCAITMELVPGSTLKQLLQRPAEDKHDEDAVMRAVAIQVARMHANDVVHGDLTTSNVIVAQPDSHDVTVTLIDFGLSSSNAADEDFAVDLYVFERAVIATHAQKAVHLNAVFLEQYSATRGSKTVLTKLDDVRARGRKRDMVG